jgi:hypothetical protein
MTRRPSVNTAMVSNILLGYKAQFVLWQPSWKIKGKMTFKVKNNHSTLLTMPKLMVKDTSLKVVAYYWP